MSFAPTIHLERCHKPQYYTLLRACGEEFNLCDTWNQLHAMQTCSICYLSGFLEGRFLTTEQALKAETAGLGQTA